MIWEPLTFVEINDGGQRVSRRDSQGEALYENGGGTGFVEM
jgi:hypothetical protein